MKYEYKSVLRAVILELVDEKRKLGFKYETEEKYFKGIDRLAISVSLAVPVITKEFAEEFVKIHSNETPTNSHLRCSAIRVLARHMARKGMVAYVIPPLPAGSYRRTFAPHVFTDGEIRRILETADTYAGSLSLDGHTYRQRKKYPVILRILYSTGMRIGEVLSLRLGNIDFKKSTFTILHAKNNSERVIPVHRNALKSLRDYIIENKIVKEDQYVFSGRTGGRIGYCVINQVFLRLLRIARIAHTKGGPRLHDFRHTFCVHRLRDWVLEGKDVGSLFPYLCAYMGHADTRCTEYYLRLTADIYPDVVEKMERHFNGEATNE